MAKKDDQKQTAEEKRTESAPEQYSENMEGEGNAGPAQEGQSDEERDMVKVPRQAVEALGGVDGRRVADEDPTPEPPNQPGQRPQRPEEEASGA